MKLTGFVTFNGKDRSTPQGRMKNGTGTALKDKHRKRKHLITSVAPTLEETNIMYLSLFLARAV